VPHGDVEAPERVPDLHLAVGHPRVLGWGFGVWGLGFRVQDLGSRV